MDIINLFICGLTTLSVAHTHSVDKDTVKVN
jgi:hypothetical protein